MAEQRLALDDGSLVDVLDRLVTTGAAVDGSLVITLAGVDLARLDLRLLLTAARTCWPRSAAGDSLTGPPIRPTARPPLPNPVMNRAAARGLGGALRGGRTDPQAGGPTRRPGGPTRRSRRPTRRPDWRASSWRSSTSSANCWNASRCGGWRPANCPQRRSSGWGVR